MATYYVRTDGNDANAGTGQASNQAWKTIQKALGATGISSGDTVYIAPGRYNEFITIGMTSATATTYIIGDVGATQFTGITPGVVRLTAHSTDAVNATSTALITATSKNYLYWQGIYFEQGNSVQSAIATCRYWTFTKCTFVNAAFLDSGYRFTNTAGVPFDLTVSKCVFVCGYGLWIRNTRHSASYDIGVNISDCLCYGINNSTQPVFYFEATGSGTDGNGAKIFNCSLFGTSVYNANTSTTTPTQITNCVGVLVTTFVTGNGTTASTVVTNCRYPNSSVSNATVTNSSSLGVIGLDFSQTMLGAGIGIPVPSPYDNSILINGGTSTGAPVTDIYGYKWTLGTDIGAFSRTSLSSTSFYLPTERNASTITIAPGSTSQSIELYLGATGLTFSTSGLAAYYVRNQSAPVAITLVTQTPTGAWSSGGFAEISSSLVPGVYRLDVPNAAFAAGQSDVTIVVRGASGTNGAVMTVKLSSGGLTAAQTASAVWGASVAGYVAETDFGGVVNATRNVVGGLETQLLETPAAVWDSLTDNHGTHGTFGWGVLRADQDSKQGLVTLHSSGGINRVDSDVHAIQNDTAAATELKGALLHNGTDYISADLLVPVTSATTLRMGPYLVKPDGGGADGALDINQGTAGSVVVQLVDATGAGINQTASTVQAKVYNAGGTLVATYTCTAEYATDGWLAIPLTTTVSGTAGTYTVTLWSTVGATVTVYGPLSMRVRAI